MLPSTDLSTSADSIQVSFADQAFLREEVMRRRRYSQQERRSKRSILQYKLGRLPVRLSNVEFRILRFLAARPYHAFSPRMIAEAVTTEGHPVAEEALGEYITSLRRQLGVFHDYVQTVPYIGYRFRA